ncbi:Hypothetical_protein [Hexamita inflata]|uniref:Hypothetical_protein n=1 Tax=Hexamita inflata TaxID=28002 RepID=A0AA86TKJ3_9EUKA|nr:Hypothetical protein HINF_LOCUS6030 [Hexamita inflata]CAI9918402.1 Hypothetical protein HINF_LOCUS6047 [Hexamita inflata]
MSIYCWESPCFYYQLLVISQHKTRNLPQYLPAKPILLSKTGKCQALQLDLKHEQNLSLTQINYDKLLSVTCRIEVNFCKNKIRLTCWNVDGFTLAREAQLSYITQFINLTRKILSCDQSATYIRPTRKAFFEKEQVFNDLRHQM